MALAPLADTAAAPQRAGGPGLPVAALARAALLLALLLTAGFAARAFGPGLLGHADHSLRGVASFVVAGALLSAAGVPRQAVAFAAGYAFGLWPGTALALLAQMAGCAADFGYARITASGWAARRVRAAGGGWLARVDRLLADRPFATTLTLRLLPVGNNLVLNLLAGLSRVSVLPFLAATLLGYLPHTLVFTLAGSGTVVGRGTQIGLGVALFAVSSALGLLLARSMRALAPGTESLRS